MTSFQLLPLYWPAPAKFVDPAKFAKFVSSQSLSHVLLFFNRLTTWQTPLASASTQQQAWNYDNAGNWNSTTINGTTENRTHIAVDQLTQIAGNATTNDLKPAQAVPRPRD